VGEGNDASLASFLFGKHPASSTLGAQDVDVSTEEKDEFGTCRSLPG